MERKAIQEKPTSCRVCVGYTWPPSGWGFCGPSGSGANGVLLVGEMADEEEAKKGTPFVGAAGFMLTQLLQRGGMKRENFRLVNVLSCHPPNNKLRGMPYEADAIQTCRPNLECVLHERQWGCIVACGDVALRSLLPMLSTTLLASRGYVFKSEAGWILPTFHPVFLQRGQPGLVPVVIHDLQRAEEIAKNGYRAANLSHFLLDPTPAVALTWSSQFEQERGDHWLSVDIETSWKQGDEDELRMDTADRCDSCILRCGYSWGAGQRVLSASWGGAYDQVHRRLLGNGAPKLFWNAPFDVGILRSAGMTINGQIHDGMVAWHVLNSDMKKNLGFVATFYCHDLPMWKHLARTQPAFYNACDAYAADRIMFEGDEPVGSCGGCS